MTDKIKEERPLGKVYNQDEELEDTDRPIFVPYHEDEQISKNEDCGIGMNLED